MHKTGRDRAAMQYAKQKTKGTEGHLEGTAQARGATEEWRAYWPVVLAAFAGMGMSTIAMYTTGLFIEPIEQAFGWSRAQIMSGHMLNAIVGVIGAPFIGAAIDRYGPRRLGIAACIIVPISFAMLGITGDNLWQWRGLWLFFAFAALLLQPAIWTAAVTSFFNTGRGFALACTLCGSGFASIAMPPLAYAAIEMFGWRWGFSAIALFWFVIAFPLVTLFFYGARDRHRKQSGGAAAPLAPTENFGHVLRTVMLSRRFIQVAIAGLMIATVVVSIVASVVPIMVSNGLDRVTAASIAGVLGFAAIGGRLTIGFLLDRIQARYLAAAMLSTPVLAISLLILMPQSIPAALAAVLIIGLALGAELDLLAYITSRYFALRYFGTLFGTVGGFITLAGGAGPVILNWVYDIAGSYEPAMLAAIPISLTAALLFLLLGPYPDDPDGQESGE